MALESQVLVTVNSERWPSGIADETSLQPSMYVLFFFLFLVVVVGTGRVVGFFLTGFLCVALSVLECPL